MYPLSSLSILKMYELQFSTLLNRLVQSRRVTYKILHYYTTPHADITLVVVIDLW